MTAITMEQRRHIQAAAGRVAAKLESFYESLPGDEQFALDISLPRLLSGEANVDVSGYAPKRDVVTAIAKAIVYYITNATPVWSDDFPDFPYTGPTSSSNPEFQGGSNGTHVQ